MELFAEILDRDFSIAVGFPNVRLEVTGFDYDANGGPKSARIIASGTRNSLEALINWLRAPVIIRDEDATDLWRGCLTEVQIQIGAIKWGASIDTMYNRVNVVYSYVAPGSSTVGTRASTGYDQDDDSVASYGERELLYSISGDTPDSAEHKRDAVLEAFKLPQPRITSTFGQEQLRAELFVTGWYDTLAWTYLSRAALRESNTDQTATDQNVGDVTANTQCAQSFQTSSSWNAYSIEVNLKKTGTPADNVQVTLNSDSGGQPGAVLDTITLSGGDIGTSYAYASFVLTSLELLAASTTYWIVVSRTGAIDAANYYTWGVDEALSYASGVFRIYNGATWGARTPDADALFRVNGVQETTEQIEEIITAEGQFFEGVIIEDTSGVYLSPYQNGDKKTLSVIKALLARGTTNGRVLFADVTPERYLRIYEEPEHDPSAVEVRMESDGTLKTKTDTPWQSMTPPVGKLCQLKDILAQLDQSLLADPSLFVIQSAAFDVGRSSWTQITVKGQPTPWDIVSVTEG